MHSSDIWNDTISAEALLHIILMWLVPVKGTELTDWKRVSSVYWLKNNKTQQLVSSTLFYQSSWSLIWKVSSDKQISFAVAAYSEEHTK